MATMNPLARFAQFMRGRRQSGAGDMTTQDSERLANYGRYLRAYEGYSIRGTLGTGTVSAYKRLKFNYNEPIVNLTAGFLAGGPIAWKVQGDPDATRAAHAIWDRSGSDAEFLEAVTTACIYGDLALFATANEFGDPRIEFVEPTLCFPCFDGADYKRLHTIEVAYERLTPDGRAVFYREMWGPDAMEAWEDDTLVERRPYDMMPAAWVRNAGIKGKPFGYSDLHGVWDLVEEYDHIASKQTRIIDYYAAPTPVFKGINPGSITKKDNTAYFLPTDGDARFLEWSGNTPDIDAHLSRIRNAIAEKSQVPAVAFGQADSGLTSISGVALQILYGPLISKTRRKQSQWGPALEYVMWHCLRAAGFDVTLTAVDILWPDSLPVDGREQSAIQTTEVAAQIRSRRSAMQNAGITDPDDEIKRIVIEQRLLALAGPQPDAYKAAQAATKGSPGDTGPAAGQEPAAATDSTPSAPGIDEVLAQIDVILAQEDANITAQRAREAAAGADGAGE